MRDAHVLERDPQRRHMLYQPSLRPLGKIDGDKIDPAPNAASAVICHAPESTMVMGIAALNPSYGLLQLNLRKA
jgi:hypothetical protein